jgi:putative redox protein
MIEARAIWTDKERFLGEAASGHAIVVDAGTEKTASTPVELVLIALCACTSVDVVGILKKKREPFTSLEVRAKAERSEEFPKIFTSIKLIYRVGGKVTHKAMEDAVRLSKDKYCSVSAMLQASAKIDYEIEYADSHEHEKLPDRK